VTPQMDGHLDNAKPSPSPLRPRGGRKSDAPRRPSPGRSLIAATLLLTFWACGLIAAGRFGEDLARRAAPGLDLPTLARALGLTRL
jgi:hypothetical protein